jgi:signal transduction histidine kinase
MRDSLQPNQSIENHNLDELSTHERKSSDTARRDPNPSGQSGSHVVMKTLQQRRMDWMQAPLHNGWRWMHSHTTIPFWQPRQLRRAWVSYLAGVLIILIVLAIVVGLLQILPSFEFPEALLLLATVMIAFVWGAGPGIVATLVSTFSAGFLETYASWDLAFRSEEDYPGVVLLFVVGMVLNLMVAREFDLRGRAEEASARMEHFLHLVSHELRTPITSLKMTLEMASRSRGDHFGTGEEEQPTLPERTEHLLDRARRQVDQLNRLVQDLVEAARAESGKLSLELEPCDLAMLLDGAFEDFRQTEPKRELRLRGEDGPVPVVVDAARIQQVVVNYLSNGCKYSPSSMPVTLFLQRDGETAWVGVRDHGPGLTPEQQQRIWMRGERLEEIVTQSGGGVNLGLGLYLCRAIVLAHGGQAGVESTPREGSTFWFTLPLAERV